MSEIGEQPCVLAAAPRRALEVRDRLGRTPELEQRRAEEALGRAVVGRDREDGALGCHGELELSPAVSSDAGVEAGAQLCVRGTRVSH